MNIKQFFFLSFFMTGLIFFNACGDDFSCTDGKQNQGERGIDCDDDAGKCPPCGLMQVDTMDTEMPIDTTEMTNLGQTGGDNNGLSCLGMTNPQFCAEIDGLAWSSGVLNPLDEPFLNLNASGLIGAVIDFADFSQFNFVMQGTPPGLGTYEMNENTLYISHADSNGEEFKITGNKGSGTMTIQKLDPSAKALSGTFEFIGFNIEETDSVIVSNGNFIDLKYN